ncbi:hypothetical protein H2198_005950 [Neophaeococcomyces mojaviensis]|uniref:Uncharacterized protein n=1 Tax=Neophaeococcomyces mojaviensis TaxID=3383035 RepID=A0ACC3A465_9EURO|nr:hypothetical protein H2198_005950 [Knufia sp. JES_112]
MDGFRGWRKRHLSKEQNSLRFQPLNLSQNEIRLIKFVDLTPNAPLELRLDHFALLHAPQYVALSYCWGENLQPYTVQINDKAVTINPNLHHALAALRKHCSQAVEEYFWIDALCIDQNNEEEKGAQISRMASLFQRASQVVAYLGQPDHDSGIVIEYIQKRRKSVENFGAADAVLSKQLLSAAISTLFKRAWFSRIWIVQEFSVASTLLFMVGNAHFYEQELNHLVDLYDQMNGASFLRLLPAVCLLLMLRKYRITHTPLSLLDIIRMTSWNTNAKGPITFRSTDLRDQIYALLGLVYDHATWISEPSYVLSVNDLFIEMTRTAVKSTRSLNVILLEGATDSPRRVSDFGSKDGSGYDPNTRPSWCPDYLNIRPRARNTEVIDSLYATSIIFGRMQYFDFRDNDSRSRLDSLSRCIIGPRILEIRAVMLGTISDRQTWLSSSYGLSCISQLRAQPQHLNDMLVIYGDEVSDVQGGPVKQDFSHCIARDLSNSNISCCPELQDAPMCQWNKRSIVKKISDYSNDNDNDVLGSLLEATNASQTEANLPTTAEDDVKGLENTQQADQPATLKDRQRAVHLAINSTWENYYSFKRKVVGLELSATLSDNLGLVFGPLNVAWTPVDSRPGDKIVVIEGCDLPVVLRAESGVLLGSHPQTWRKIGAACIPTLSAGTFWSRACTWGLDEQVHIV